MNLQLTLPLTVIILLFTFTNVSKSQSTLQFTEDNYTIYINETFPPDYLRPPADFIVFNCNSTNVTYTISSTNTIPFTIDDTSGGLTVISDLDYETTTSYQFEVICTSNTLLNSSDSANVNIQILPVNEFRPSVSRTVVTVSITESSPPVGTTLVSSVPGNTLNTYSVSDRDLGPDNQIFFTDEVTRDTVGISNNFAFNSTVGAIVIASKVDLDVPRVPIAFLTHRITVCDVDPPHSFCPILSVSITVTASNDNSPMFTADYYNTTLSEATLTNTVLVNATCTDADVGTGSLQGIEIVQVLPSSVPNGTFTINDMSGAVTLSGILDYELTRTYELELRCSDTSNLQDTAYVVIEVEDANDNAPVIITGTNPFERVNDATQIGSTLLSFQCSDDDSGENSNITYSIQGNETATPFSIDPLTGDVFIRESLQLPSDTFIMNYTIGLQCQDNGDVSLMTGTSLVVEVYKNDSTPPEIDENSISGGTIQVREDVGIGYVLATVIATDETSPSVTFSFERESNPGYFEIDSQSGEITLSRSLDREDQQSYTFRVSATEVRVDLGTPRTVFSDVVVVVTDVNDNAPAIITGTDPFERVNDATQIGSRLLSFQCSDDDSGENSNITYSIQGNETATPFSIDPLTGDVFIRESLQLPSDTFIMNYTIGLQCQDNGDVSLMTGTSLVVEVYKNDSTPPEIDENSISGGTIQVREDVSIGLVLATVIATDETSPSVTFSFERESNPGYFEINSQSGEITLSRTLDREDQDSYTLRVSATEVRVAPGTPRTVSSDVVVVVTDVNDNAPRCSERMYSTNITTGMHRATSLLNISCSDADIGVNAQLRYTVVSSLPAVDEGRFMLNENSGEITFNGILTNNTSYTFEVAVSDSGTPSLSTTVSIKIIVTDHEEIVGLPLPLYAIIVIAVVGGLLLICCFLIFCLCCCYFCNRRRVVNKKKKLLDVNEEKYGKTESRSFTIFSQYPQKGPEEAQTAGTTDQGVEFSLTFETTSFSEGRPSVSPPSTTGPSLSSSPNDLDDVIISTNHDNDVVIATEADTTVEECTMDFFDSTKNDFSIELTQESMDIVMSKV